MRNLYVFITIIMFVFLLPGLSQAQESSVILFLPYSHEQGGVRVNRTGMLYKPYYDAAGLVTTNSEYHPTNNEIGIPKSQRGAIDFNLPDGAKVLASAPGTATDVTPCSVGVRHADGTTSYYLHLSAVHVENDVPIERGQHIGDVGANCGADGFHLHFALWSGNKEIKAFFADASVQEHDGIVRPSRTGYYEFRYTADANPQPNLKYNYAYLSQNTPPSPMTAGSDFTLSFTLKNTGTETWQQGVVKLGAVTPGADPPDRSSPFYQAGNLGWSGPNRIELKESSVAPEQNGTFEAVITAPSTPGNYREDFRPVVEGVEWMNLGPALWFEVEVVADGGNGDCPSPDTTFCDVPTDHTFYYAAEALYEAGLTNGCRRDGDQLFFCPDDPLLRQQGAALVARWLYDYDDMDDLPPPIHAFNDMANDPDGEFLRAIDMLHRDGIVNGFGLPANEFRPLDPMSRDHAMTIVVRTLLKHQPVELQSDIHFSDTDDPLILKGAELKITSIASGGEFKPNDTATRGQMAAFICRAFLSGSSRCDETPVTPPTELATLRDNARMPRTDDYLCFTASQVASERGHLPGLTVTEDGMPASYWYAEDVYRPDCQPAGMQLQVQPALPTVNLGSLVSVALNVQDATDLYGLQVTCQANPDMLTLEETEFGDFFSDDPLKGVDDINADAGSWTGALSQQNPAPALFGNGLFATLTFKAAAVGTAQITCESLAADRDGFSLPISDLEATVTVINAVSGSFSGMIKYQGRTNHTGIEVSATGPDDQTTLTDSAGQVLLTVGQGGEYGIEADADLYLPSCTSATTLNGQATPLPATQLAGGDTNDNDKIQIGDASLVGSNFGLTNSTTPKMNVKADINADGQVNVQDLSILGGNFGKEDCQQW